MKNEALAKQVVKIVIGCADLLNQHADLIARKNQLTDQAEGDLHEAQYLIAQADKINADEWPDLYWDIVKQRDKLENDASRLFIKIDDIAGDIAHIEEELGAILYSVQTVNK